MDEMVTERDYKESTVPEEKSGGPSPDLMSAVMEAMMIQMVKMITQVKMACLWQACSNLVYKVV